ncbi:MAG: universal stress protein [Desulfobacterales bacterium]|nr:universal stress protein [Desulfobacterales bacterium]
MFEKILFATTASPACDAGANVAFDLAKKYNSKLYVFHVLGMPSRGFGSLVVDSRTGEQENYDQDYIDWVKEEMKNTYSKQIADAKNVQIETCSGNPPREILRIARKEDIDLIVMGSHTRKEEIGASRYRNVAGNTMQNVAKAARCPVLIVNRPCTTCFWYFSNIIFGTDFSKASYSAFLFAYKTAKAIGCKLHIFHALDISSMYSGKVISQEEIEKQIKEARKKMEETYVSKMEDFDNYSLEVWEGVPYVEILKFSRAKSGDLVVLAHHTREIDPEEAILGSTVEQVVLRSTCPVASVNHPDKVEHM